MDLSVLNTKEKSESGVWTQVKYLGTKLPVEILIYGEDCDKVQKYNAEKAKKLGTIKAAIASGEMTAEDIDIKELDTSIEDAVARTAGMRTTDGTPLTIDGVDVGNDVESYRLVYTSIPEIRKFVLREAGDSTNFLPNGKKSLKELSNGTSS